MTSSSRREFFHQVGAAGLAAWSASCAPPAPKQTFDRPLGVQLYTLRRVLPRDPRAVLKTLSEIGYSQLEILAQDFEDIRPAAREFGLAPVSGHFPSALLTGNWDVIGGPPSDPPPTWDQAVEQARDWGLRCMVVAYVFPQERGDLDFYRRLAEGMNEAGEQCREAGIQLCYHHHSFEFEPLEGRRPFDLLVEEFDPQLVHWQLDVFWLHMAGEDPAETIRRFSGRVASLHLKDAAPQSQPHFQESEVSPADFAEVGGGKLDFPKILKAALETSVPYFFVEQDETPGDPLDSLRKSCQYLRGVEV